jgi:hypothetical protein
MKKSVAIAAVLLFIALAIFVFPSPKEQTPAIVAPTTQNSSTTLNQSSSVVPFVPTSSTGSNSSGIIASPDQAQPPDLAARAGELVPDSNPRTEVRPETALQNVLRAVRQYGEMFGGNPVGTNPEITSQLSGDNPRHINFINPQPGARINANGELPDAWGTPYFFHQLSGTEMEVHSAGPDKIMWTDDDLVVH